MSPPVVSTPPRMVHVACPICGSAPSKQLYPDTLRSELPRFGYDFSPAHTKTYRVVFCEPCHHGFSSPRPASLWSHYEDMEDQEYLARQEERLITAQKVVNRLRRFLPAGRLLDVGCGTGDFLSVARQAYEAEGLELSLPAAETARRLGLTVHRCRLKDLQAQAPYDVITLWGVIEHFEEPSEEIALMARLLRPGGLVCLWTGDLQALPSRLLGRNWWYVQGQHLQLFSRYSLCKLFERQGFRTAWIGRYPYVMTCQSIRKSLSRYPALGTVARWVLGHPSLATRAVTLALPGEMFAVFRKPEA